MASGASCFPQTVKQGLLQVCQDSMLPRAWCLCAVCIGCRARWCAQFELQRSKQQRPVRKSPWGWRDWWPGLWASCKTCGKMPCHNKKKVAHSTHPMIRCRLPCVVPCTYVALDGNALGCLIQNQAARRYVIQDPISGLYSLLGSDFLHLPSSSPFPSWDKQ